MALHNDFKNEVKSGAGFHAGGSGLTTVDCYSYILTVTSMTHFTNTEHSQTYWKVRCTFKTDPEVEVH